MWAIDLHQQNWEIHSFLVAAGRFSFDAGENIRFCLVPIDLNDFKSFGAQNRHFSIFAYVGYPASEIGCHTPLYEMQAPDCISKHPANNNTLVFCHVGPGVHKTLDIGSLPI